MDDREFANRADACLNSLHKRLTAASDDADFESDFNNGALTVEFEDPPGKFVVSPNSPVHQIWLSAHSKSFKFAWDDSRSDFVLPETGQTLVEVVGDAVAKQLGEDIKL